MAEVVDSIIAELIAKDNGYIATFDAATAAHGRFKKSVDALKVQTFDLGAEAQKYRQGGNQIAQAEEQTTQRVVRAKKQQSDAAKATSAAEKQAAKESAAAAKAAAKERADAAKAIAKAEADAAKEVQKRAAETAAAEQRLAVAAAAATRQQIEELERLKAAEREATNQAKANAFLTGGGSGKSARGSASVFREQLPAYEAERAEKAVPPSEPINLFSDYDAKQAAQRAGGAGIGATVGGRADAAAATDIMRQTQVEAEGEVEAEKEVNHEKIAIYDITQRLKVAEGEVAKELETELEWLRRIATYKQLGKSETTAQLHAEEEMTAMVALRAEKEEKAALAQKAQGSGVGKNLARFGEGAGLGRAFGSTATVAGIVTGAAVAGVADLAKKGLEYAETLKQDSDQLGLTTKDFQLYQRAAQEAGVTTDQFKSAFSALAENIGKAQDGDKQLGKVFGKDGLNIDLGNAKEGFKSLSDVLPTYLNRLKDIPDQTKRFALETASGTDAMRKMDPVLRQGSSSFDQWASGVEKAGGVLSDSDIQKSDQTAKKIKDLNDQLQRDLASTVSNNAKSIEQLATAFFHAAEGALKFFSAMTSKGNLDILNNPELVKAGTLLTGKDPKDVRQQAFSDLLSNPDDRRTLYARNDRTLSILGQYKDNQSSLYPLGYDDPDLADTPNTPAGRHAAYQRAISERAQIVAAEVKDRRQDQPDHPPAQPGSPGSGNIFGGNGRKGPSPEALDAAEQERTKRFQDTLDGLRDDALRAQEQMTGSIQKQADIEKQLADEQLKKLIGDPAKGIKGDYDLQAQRDKDQIAKGYGANSVVGKQLAQEVDERTAQLKAQAQKTHDVQQEARDQQTLTTTTQAELQHAQTQLQIDDAALNNRLALARTTKDRLAIEEQLLENAKQQKLNDLNSQLAGLKPGDPRIADVQKQIGAVNSDFAGQLAGLKDRELTPGQQYVRSLQSTPDTIQQKEVDILGKFNDQLDQTISKALHLHGIFGDIVNDLIDMVVKQGLIAPLANLMFPGTPGAPTGGGLSGIGGLLGGFGRLLGLSSGGLDISGNTAAISSSLALSNSAGEAGIFGGLESLLPGLAGGGSIDIMGNGGIDKNLLSLNGQPVARVNMGEQIHVVNPNQKVNSSGSSTMALHQTINIDNRSSLTPSDFAQQIIAVSASHANKVAAQRGAQAVQASPAQVRQTQTLKG